MTSSIGEQTVHHRNDRREPMELNSLRQMNLDQRLDWMRSKFRQRMGLLFLKVDGYLVACGTEEEFDDILARFLMFIARETMLAETPESLLAPYIVRLRELGVTEEISIKADVSTEYRPHFTVFIGDTYLHRLSNPFPCWSDIESLARHYVNNRTTDTESKTK